MASSREGCYAPLVLVTQVCSHQNRVLPQPLASGQGGVFGSGPRSSVPWLELGLLLSCRM